MMTSQPQIALTRVVSSTALVLALLIPGALAAEPSKVAARRVQLDAQMRAASRLNPRMATRASAMADPGSLRVPLLVETTLAPRSEVTVSRNGDEALQLTACIGTVCAGMARQDSLDSALAQPWVRRVELAGRLHATGTPAASEPAAAASTPTHTPLPRPAATGGGSGVLIAFVDTGIDIFHPDFRNLDGTTRIKALLDLSEPGDSNGDGLLDGTGPYGGTEWSESDINAALTAGAFTSKDLTGHGTHGLSVAAGGGKGLAGIAPAADLLVVKATRQRESLEFEAVDLIAALAWIEQKATSLSKPVVVNLSLGTDLSSHDGRSLEEMAVDQFGGQGKNGRVVVVAAGNAGSNASGAGYHAKGAVTSGRKNSHALTIPSYTPRTGSKNDRLILDLWHDGSATLGLEVVTPSGQVISAASGAVTYKTTAEGDVLILNEGLAVAGGSGTEALVVIDDYEGDEVVSGTWTLRVGGERVHGQATYDLWMVEASSLGTASLRPAIVGGDLTSYIGKPGGAFTAITVGSYAEHQAGSRFLTSWTDVTGRARLDDTATIGALSDFSSTGPMRDGRIKPELTAPGERTLGAVSRDAYPGQSASSIYIYHPWPEAEGLIAQNGASGAYGLLQGTSFAAPVVTGLAARVLELHPTWDGERVRNALIRSAKSDARTGLVPNGQWGWGKVDLALAVTTPVPGTLRIATPNLPTGREGNHYTANLTATGGTRPYVWRSAGGDWPTGLSVDPLGRIVGTPAVGGTFTVTVAVRDAESVEASATLDLRIKPASELDIISDGLPSGTVDTAYSEPLVGAGGQGAYQWSVAAGSLPSGFTLSPAGLVSGTSSTAGTSCFTIKLQDAANAAIEKSFCLTVDILDRDSWTQRGLIGASVTALMMLPSNPQVIYLGTDGNGLYVTRNQGLSFSHIPGVPRARITRITASPMDENRLYVSTAANGAFLSTDGGRSWTAMMAVRTADGQTTAYTAANFFKEDISDPNRLWYGSQEYYWFHSTDRGTTWLSHNTPAECALIGTEFRDLVQDPRDPDRVYLAARANNHNYGQIYFSTDHGETWSYSGTGLWTGGHWMCGELPGHASFDRVWLDPLNPDVIYAASTYGYLLKSSDKAQSWVQQLAALVSDLAFGPVSGDLYCATQSLVRVNPSTGAVVDIGSGRPGWSAGAVSTVVVNPSDENNILVGTDRGVLATYDGGQHWESRARGLLAANVIDAAIGNGTQVVLTSDGVFVSLLGGATWSKLTLPPNLSSITLGFGSAADDIYGATKREIFRYDHGGSIVRISDSIPIAQTDTDWIWSVSTAERSGGTRIYCVTSTQLSADTVRAFVSDDRGTSWVATEIPYTSTGIWDLGNLLFAQGKRSADGGATWSSHTSPAGNDPYTTYCSRYARFTPTGPVWANCHWHAWTGSYEIRSSWLFRSDDEGATFTSPYPFWGVSPAFRSQIGDVVGRNRGTQLLIATKDQPDSWGGLYSRAEGILSSEDGGATYTPRNTDYPASVSTTRLLYDASKDLLLAATAGTGVFLSWDGAAHWQEANSFTSVAATVSDVVQLDANRVVVASAGYGVYMSQDGGSTYAPINTGLTGGFDVRALSTDADGGLWAATAAGLYFAPSAGAAWTKTAVNGSVTDVETDGQGSAKRIWATVGGSGVAHSSDGGTNWTVDAQGLASLDFTGLELEDTGVAKRIWATTKGGDGAYFSDDGGTTWTPVEGIGLANHDVNDLKVEGGTAKRIWATTDDGAYASSDGGRTWQDASAGLPRNVPLTSMTFDPNSGEAIVSANHAALGGVYRGGNVTGFWSPYSSGLQDRHVTRVSPGASVVQGGVTRTVFHAGTDGGGLYSTGVTSGTTATKPSLTTSALPASCLRQAYSAMMGASGGQTPYTFGVVAGALPPGITLDTSGSLSGSAVKAGDFSFTVRAVDSLQQTAEHSYLLRVVDALVPTITASGPTTFCDGSSVTLTSSSSSGNQWLRDGTPIEGATEQSLLVTTAGPYSVRVTDAGCSATSAETEVTVNAFPSKPTVTASGGLTFCFGGSVTLTSSSESGNQWMKDGATIEGAAGTSYVTSTAGSFTVRVTNANGCAASSDPVQVSGSSAISVGPASLSSGVQGQSYSATFTASGGSESKTFKVTGTLPSGLTFSGATLSGTLSQIGSFPITVTATDANGCTGSTSYTLMIAGSPGSAPQNVRATGTTEAVTIVWTPVSGATAYKIYRRGAGQSYATVGASATTSYTDTTVVGDKAYLYVVRAFNGTSDSADSAPDLATTVRILDPTIVAGVTAVKFDHFCDLLRATNAVRVLAGLQTVTFTVPEPGPNVHIRARHLTDLRTAIDEARRALALPLIWYTDPTITPGETPIKAAHVNELRDGIR